MGDDYRRKIETEMDRFEAEINSLARPAGPMGGGPPQQGAGGAAPAFIPAQLRRHPVPGPPVIGGSPAIIAAAPMINRARLPQSATISGAPQVYRQPAVRQRIPVPQSQTLVQRGIRPGIRQDSVVAAPPLMIRPAMTTPTVVTGLPVPAAAGFPLPGGVPIMGTSIIPSTTNIANIPLPPEQSSSSSEPKPSTSGDTGDDANEKGKGKKKKDRKNKKLVRSAGGSVWEDQSLQDWDPSDFRLFCGDLGNDVTDEVLTRVFGRYLSFQKARVIRDKRTNKTKGYGFVSFKDPNDFVRAVKELDGRYVGSRPIKLRKSNWKNRNVDVVRKRETERMSLLGINKKPKF